MRKKKPSRTAYFAEYRRFRASQKARVEEALRLYAMQHHHSAIVKARAEGENTARAACSCEPCQQVRRLEAAARAWSRSRAG